MGYFYGKLESMFSQHVVRGMVDSVFATKNNEYLIQSAKILPPKEDSNQHLLFLEATAVIQLSEWVMRAL